MTGNFSNSLRLSAGVRWHDDSKETVVDNSADHARPTLITLQMLPEFANAALARDATGISWELIGSYHPDDDSMAYLQASKGIKPGGFNGGFGATPPDAREFADETVTGIELGYKARFPGARLQFNGAVFSATYSDYQSAGWVGLRFLVNNADEVDVSGAELDVHATISDRLSSNLAISYVDARYDVYTGGSCPFDRLPDNADGSACDLSGRTLPLAPRLSTNLNVAYQRQFGPNTLYGSVDWAWTSDYHTNASLDARHIQGAFGFINARLGFRFDSTEVIAWIRNAGNEVVAMREGPSNLFPRDAAYARFLALPRSFGLTVRISL